MTEYIEKQELISCFRSLKQPKTPITEGFSFISIDDAVKVVDEMVPTADVAPVIHAKWVLDHEFTRVTSGEIIGAEYHCSECDRIVICVTHGKPLLEAYPYCHCGARMDGE